MSAELRCPAPRVEERHERLMVVVETALGARMPDGDLKSQLAGHHDVFR
jgi:hypothetical protein